MSKTYTYVVMAVTMMAIMTFMGLPTGFSSILEQVGLNYTVTAGVGTIESSNVVGSFIYNNLLVILALALGATITIGFLTKSSTENIIMLGFVTGVLVLFVGTFSGIMNSVIATAPGWGAALIVTIFLPITVGLVISLAEWFKGADN